MRVSTVLGGLAAGLGMAMAAQAAGKPCQLENLLEIPVTMVDLSPVMTAKINGAEAQFLVDSGAFYSFLSHAAAAQYRLKIELAPSWLRVSGIGGSAEIHVATVNDFGFGSQVAHHIQFLVGGTDLGKGIVGLLGQNVLGLADVEFDLAHGVVRLVRPHDCGEDDLAYWSRSMPHSVLSIESSTSTGAPQTAVGEAYVNGARVKVKFDSGASLSMLTQEAARRIGVRTDSAGVVPGGLAQGIGRRAVDTWIAPFASFRIADEEVRNTRLRISAADLPDADMLLGADFFLSHHIYIANSQRRLYFSYNGGPVFNLKSNPAPAAAPAATAAAAAAPTSSEAEPADADGFSRRGTAFEARHDYTHALADLTRACELAPGEPRYLYERARIYLQLRETGPARADLDRALTLRPEHLPSLLLRSELRLSQEDRAGALADADVADRVAPRESNDRLALGEINGNLDRLPAAIVQYDQWIASHDDDPKLFQALNSRCWTKALLAQDLDHALSDCNRALRLRPESSMILDSRGLVLFRRGEFKQSLKDYDAALKLNQNSAWSRYVRGLDLLRLGRIGEGNADLAAAAALAPKIAEHAAKYGIVR
jgi:tetratricopeptide (TPR) repeat protein